MYVVYVLKSQVANRYYVGMTEDLADRLRHHNSGATRSTKPYCPWGVVYQEQYPDKKSAWWRERQIKSYKGGEAFKKLLINHGEVA